MANIEEKVENLIKEKIENIGYSLYDVEYAKEGKNFFLRIFIEKQNGTINLEDCEKVNNEITDILDEANYIKEQYFLEVSSTGVEKILRKEKHLKDNIENEIEIKLFKMQNNKKTIIGDLIEFDNKILKLKEKKTNKEIEIERKNIAQIKTTYDWGSNKNQ